jgi:beta-aspartyl-peptidase (threonine type)
MVHGGADTILKGAYRDGVMLAAKAGGRILSQGGSALDATEEAVKKLEDIPLFDAGTGSSLCYDGTAIMHASIMDGMKRTAGAVTLIENVKNPISVARLVMEKTDYVVLGAETANAFARAMGFPEYDPVTEERKKELQMLKKRVNSGRSSEYLQWHFRAKTKALAERCPQLFGGDTVGAVAIDQSRNVAAAASTGGFTMQMPGRIGDTPIIGAGIYAENESGAASVTGWGEVSIRYVVAKEVCTSLRSGMSPQDAVERIVGLITKEEGPQAAVGVIAIDTQGEVGVAYNTRGLAHAYSRIDLKPKFQVRPRRIRKRIRAVR